MWSQLGTLIRICAATVLHDDGAVLFVGPENARRAIAHVGVVQHLQGVKVLCLPLEPLDDDDFPLDHRGVVPCRVLRLRAQPQHQ